MRLIQWQNLAFTVDGDHLAELLRGKIAESGAPIENLTLTFGDNEAEVGGTFHKVFSVPFRIRLTAPTIDQGKLRIPIEAAGVVAAAMSMILPWFAPEDLYEGRVLLDRDNPAILVDLESFVPEFVDLEILEVRIAAAGIEVEAGPGGSDLPPRPRE